MNYFEIPVLFLVFNRFDTTKLVFDKIKEIKPSFLYVASDGARAHQDGEADIVQNIRDYIINNVDWDCDIKYLFRSDNLGCQDSVAGALEWFFANEEMGIILEDDCLPNDSFFDFCKEMLIRYKDDRRVWSISGYNMLGETQSTSHSYDFTRIVSIWGWATWRDRFAYYNKNIPTEYLEYIDSGNISNYHDNGLNHFLELSLHELFKTNTWDIQWLILVIVNNGLVIFPRVSLIKNIGLDSGTHYVGKNKLLDYNYYVNNDKELSFPLIHPHIINSSKHIETQIMFRLYYANNKLKYKLYNYLIYDDIYKVYKILLKPLKILFNSIFKRY